MSLTPKVTVYIPSKNYAKYLEQSINSVLTQSIKEWELILIDDASEDNSFSVMNKFVGDSRIKVFRSQGIGLPAVANLALELSHGEYLIRLDGDDFFHPMALEILCSSLDKNAGADFVFPDYYEIDSEGRLLGLNILEDMNYFDHYRSIPPHGASTMWRKKVLQNLGGYREDLRAQDGLDIWLRGKSRQSFSHVSLPLFYYRKHNFNLTNSKQLISKARSRIKLDAAIAAGPKPNISAIIPCRSRFDFTPNLWNLEIAKKSLLRYALDSCLASPLIDRVYVLGDTDEIKTEVEKIKSQIKDSIPITFVHRPIYDTREYVPLVNALKNFIETDDSLADGIFLVRHLHAPFVSSQEITELLSNLILEESTSAALVSKLDWTILSRNRFGLQVVYERNFITTSMDSFYQYRNSAMATFASNLKKSSLWGASTSFIESNSAGQFIIDSHNKIDMASIFSNDASNA